MRYRIYTLAEGHSLKKRESYLVSRKRRVREWYCSVGFKVFSYDIPYTKYDIRVHFLDKKYIVDMVKLPMKEKKKEKDR